MTYKTKLQFLFVLCYSVNIASFAQISHEGFEKIPEQLDSLSPNNQWELIYLQTSKGIYETGEDLWFKAYVLDAQYLNPSKSSQTLYLQLLSKKTRKPVW